MKKSLKLFSVFCLMALLIIAGCTNSTKMYFVNFNTFDGSTIPQLKVSENQNLVLPSDPTKTGYEFDGWYLDFDLTKELTLPYKVTSNITLYAKWTKINSDKVIDIRIDDSLVKKEYNALETFDKTNLKVIKVFAFGDTETALDSEISIDKTVLHGDDSKVTVTCSNISKEIKIKVNKLDYVLPNFTSQTKEYNGNVQNYDLSLISNLPETLEVIVKSNGITFGESSVTLSFKNLNTRDYNTPNDVTGIKFNVTPKVLDEKMFDEIPSVLHTGLEHKPIVNGTLNGITLVLNQDYTVTYLNNIDVGTGKALITGIGKFSGEIIKTFEIVETDIEKVLSASLYLENKYGLIFNGLVSNLPSKVDTINENNSTNYWTSTSTALFIDELGNLSVILKDEEQNVELIVTIRCNDVINYISFSFTLPKLDPKVDVTSTVEEENVTLNLTLEVKESTENEKSNVIIKESENLLSESNINLLNESEKVYDKDTETCIEELSTLLTTTSSTVSNYEDCKTYLQDVDENPNNLDNLSVWNREHVWCKSLCLFKEDGVRDDLHHIRPCNQSDNTLRINKKFGISSGNYTPSDEYKGDDTIILYLMGRYKKFDNHNFTLIVKSLNILFEWNDLNTVSGNEINNYIYTKQENRNPFIENSNYEILI